VSTAKDMKSTIPGQTTIQSVKYDEYQDSNGKIHTDIAVEPTDMSDLPESGKWAVFTLSNHSNIDIQLDSILTHKNIQADMQKHGCSSIRKGEDVVFLFELKERPKKIRIDFQASFLDFPIGEQTGILKSNILKK
jgi:hypothetical protein